MPASSSCSMGGVMMRELLADYSHWVMSLDGPAHDAIYVPLRAIAGHAVAYWVADVLTIAARYLVLEPVAFWVAEDVIRARWADE